MARRRVKTSRELAADRQRSGQGLFRLNIAIDPSPEVIAEHYERYARVKFGDWRPALRNMIPYMQIGIAKNFSSKGGALREPWTPNDPAYNLRKKKRGKAQLRLTGAMFHAFTSPSAVQELDHQHLVWGSDAFPQARSHNFGYHPSQRPFVGINKYMEKKSLEVFDNHTRVLLNDLADEIASKRGR